MLMSRERERVFSLSKFSTQAAEEDQQETSDNIFSRIYGYGGGKSSSRGAFGTNINLDEDDDDDDDLDTRYLGPERTSYPEQTGIHTKFDNFNRSSKSKGGKANPDEIEMQFM